MARGLGSLQLKVLAALNAGAVQRNKLCWELAAEARLILGDSLPSAWYSAFGRAIETLDVRDGRGLVRRRKRRLTSFEEVCRWYPFKTRSVAIRDLRMKLLPAVGEVAGYEFNDADNEIHRLRQLREADPTSANALRDEWRALRSRLVRLATHLSDIEVDIAVSLLGRGDQLFIGGDVSVATDFRSLIRRLPAASVDLSADLTSFATRALPIDTMSSLKLKSFICSVAHFQRAVAHPGLKERAKHELLHLRRADVIGLPGHRGPIEPEPDTSPGFIDIGIDDPRVEFSPLLDSLLDRQVFGQFEFLELA